jgi:hypothetical protein
MLPETREAYALREDGRHEDALAGYRRAYGRAVELRDDLQACAAAHMVAVEIAMVAGDVRERHDWNLRALEHADRVVDEQVAGWYASLYGSVGITLRLLGQSDEARRYLERGRRLAADLPDDDYGELVRRSIASQLKMLAEEGA